MKTENTQPVDDSRSDSKGFKLALEKTAKTLHF